jgi:hypothetical protein
VIALCGAVVALLFGTWALTSCSSYKVTGYDTMALPGSPVQIRAKVERSGILLINPDVRGSEVSFYRTDGASPVLLGKGTTDADGTAWLEIDAPDRDGILPLRASVGDTPGDDFIVMTAAAGRPLLVTDIDHTIADVGAIEFLTSKPEDVKTLPNAVPVLTRLAKTHGIIYLTHRDDTFTHATKAWLKHHNFPPGVVLFSDTSKTAFIGSAETGKTERIAALMKTYQGIAFGVGDRKEDGIAYANNAIRSFVIVPGADRSNPEHRDGHHEKAVIVEGWDEVEALLATPPAAGAANGE